MKRLTTIIISVVLSTPAVPALAAGDIEAGKAKSAMCAACHGADGNSINAQWPKLAGQHASYLVKQMGEFKDGTRKDATMMGMTAALNEQDMQNLGAYFASQTAQVGEADASFVQLGESIYRGGIMDKGVAACMACHGPAGTGNAPAGFPALGGQHTAYTVKALQDFQRGDRVNDINSMMRKIAFKLTPREMQAVAEYITGLQP